MADRPPEPASLRVLVRYYAAARAAAGRTEEFLRLPLGSTVADVLAAAVRDHGSALDRVLGRCSYLLDETAVRGTSTPVRDGSMIDVLPPFAGG